MHIMHINLGQAYKLYSYNILAGSPVNLEYLLDPSGTESSNNHIHNEALRY